MPIKQTVFIHEISGNIYIVHGLQSGSSKLFLEGEDYEADFHPSNWPLNNLVEIGDL